jgi:hypothetical protein
LNQYTWSYGWIDQWIKQRTSWKLSATLADG